MVGKTGRLIKLPLRGGIRPSGCPSRCGCGRVLGETERLWGHPTIEYLRGPARPGWLLLASDGAYEPHEDAGHDLAGYLSGTPRRRRTLADDAVRRAHAPPDSYADNATVLVARITC